ncbi:hypothetical protein AAY473_033150 [Plecturocebus cupreus]
MTKRVIEIGIHSQSGIGRRYGPEKKRRKGIQEGFLEEVAAEPRGEFSWGRESEAYAAQAMKFPGGCSEKTMGTLITLTLAHYRKGCRKGIAGPPGGCQGRLLMQPTSSPYLGGYDR